MMEVNRCNKILKPTMCIVHKGFRGLRAVSPASTFGSNLTVLKPAIPYEIIHSPLPARLKKKQNG